MNKKLKYLLFTSTFLFLAMGIYTFVNDQRDGHNAQKESENNDWKTYSKVSQKQIKSYTTTPEEKKDMKVDDGRDIASISIKNNTEPTPTEKERSWKGVGPRPLSAEIDNDYNPMWKEELGKNLLRFLRPKTKTIIKREGSALIKHKGKNIMVEHVVVKLKSPEGRHYGYSAYVNSSNGKVVTTWNKTIHEQFSRSALKLKPSAVPTSYRSN